MLLFGIRFFAVPSFMRPDDVLLCAISVNHACVIPALCLFVILVNSNIGIEVKTYVLIATHPVLYVPFLSKRCRLKHTISVKINGIEQE